MEKILELYKTKFNLQLEDLQKMDLLYPRINESVVPLSLTGVTPRNFYSWKENGLIPYFDSNSDEERKWVKLNVINYLWIKVIQSLRDLGVSYEGINSVKEILFTNSMYEITNPDFERLMKENFDLNEEEIETFRLSQYFFADLFHQALNEGKVSEIELTLLNQIITQILLDNSQISLIICKKNNSFIVDLYVYKGRFDFVNKYSSQLRELPHIEVPLNNLLEGFFDEPKSEKYAEIFGLINVKEKKVLDAIRKNDFLELHIKRDSSGELFIETIKDGEITDEKATLIRKILGLGDYQEVTLKYRNNKHLYFKNKKRNS